jgi:hypothetical protein
MEPSQNAKTCQLILHRVVPLATLCMGVEQEIFPKDIANCGTFFYPGRTSAPEILLNLLRLIPNILSLT